MGTDAPCRSTDGRRGRIEPEAPSARWRAMWPSDTAGGGLARPLERSRGTRGRRRRPASKPGLSWRLRLSRWPGRHPGRTVERHRNRDAIGAEQEAVGPCRVRHAAVAARDGRATASRGFTQQCGSVSSSSKDGGSLSNTNRPTPARAADAAPGAVDLSRFPPATDAPAGLPARRGSWPLSYRIDKHAVVDAPGGRAWRAVQRASLPARIRAPSRQRATRGRARHRPTFGTGNYAAPIASAHAAISARRLSMRSLLA